MSKFLYFKIYFNKQCFTLNLCEKQILPLMGFESTTSCIRNKRLTARPRAPHGRERKTQLSQFQMVFGVFFHMPICSWKVSIWRTLSKCFKINLGVVHSLPWGPRGLNFRRLLQMQKVEDSNPTEGKICFSQFIQIYEVECEELFCKINLKFKNFDKLKTKSSNLLTLKLTVATRTSTTYTYA